MKLDRELQRQILNVLADAYPVASRKIVERVSALADDDKLIANLLYLESHGLLTAGISSSINGPATVNASKLIITHRGLDFLADDGGLSAILGVVTIKLHDDTIRQLIEDKIIGSDLPPADKKRFVDQLRELPGESLKHLTTKLIDLGLSHAPDALPAIKTVLTAFSG
jgi:hypothetical protein